MTYLSWSSTSLFLTYSLSLTYLVLDLYLISCLLQQDDWQYLSYNTPLTFSKYQFPCFIGSIEPYIFLQISVFMVVYSYAMITSNLGEVLDQTGLANRGLSLDQNREPPASNNIKGTLKKGKLNMWCIQLRGSPIDSLCARHSTSQFCQMQA